MHSLMSGNESASPRELATLYSENHAQLTSSDPVRVAKELQFCHPALSHAGIRPGQAPRPAPDQM